VQVVLAPAARAREEKQHRGQLLGELRQRVHDGLLPLNQVIEQTGASTGSPVNETQFNLALAIKVEGGSRKPVWLGSTCLVSSYLDKGVLYVGLVHELFPDENLLLYARCLFSRASTTTEPEILWHSSQKFAHLGTAAESLATEELIAELSEALPGVLKCVIEKYVLKHRFAE